MLICNDAVQVQTPHTNHEVHGSSRAGACLHGAELREVGAELVVADVRRDAGHEDACRAVRVRACTNLQGLQTNPRCLMTVK